MQNSLIFPSISLALVWKQANENEFYLYKSTLMRNHGKNDGHPVEGNHFCRRIHHI